MKYSGVTQGSPENVDRSKASETLSGGLATCGDKYGLGFADSYSHENCYLGGLKVHFCPF